MTTAGPFGAGRMQKKHKATALRHLPGVGVALNIGPKSLRAWVNRIPHDG
jgi:hypothetical protein